MESNLANSETLCPAQPSCCVSQDIIDPIKSILDQFEGESSLKSLFWEVLSYDRVRETLPLSFLPQSIEVQVTHLEIFAESSSLTVLYATARTALNRVSMEQMAWSLKRRIPNCLIVMFDQQKWLIVYPDARNKQHVRALVIPGPRSERVATASSLAAWSAVDPLSDEPLEAFEVADQADKLFPGAVPKINDTFDDLERVLQFMRPEVQELGPFIKKIAKYPLLTPAQERGEDLPEGTDSPDGSSLNYHQWLLVVHNLRLVIWMALRVPAEGMEFSDTVQEGIVGLMTAARKFDPARGFRFSTYAYHWIRQSMLRALETNWNIIRWPIWKASDLIAANLNDKDSQLPPGERAVLFTSERLELVTLRCKHPFRSLVESERDQVIRKTLDRLSGRQADVIKQRFGIGFDHEFTLEEIGQKLGLTRERVRQIQEAALDRLALKEIRSLRPFGPAGNAEPERAKKARLRRELKRKKLFRVKTSR